MSIAFDLAATAAVYAAYICGAVLVILLAQALADWLGDRSLRRTEDADEDRMWQLIAREAYARNARACDVIAAAHARHREGDPLEKIWALPARDRAS